MSQTFRQGITPGGRESVHAQHTLETLPIVTWVVHHLVGKFNCDAVRVACQQFKSITFRHSVA